LYKLHVFEEQPLSARLLLNEYTHRVNNEFAAVVCMANAAIARASSETRSELIRIRSALENFARVHHLLRVPDERNSVDGCAYLRALCGAISASRLERRGIELVLVERSFVIDSELCWRLGVIVSELITNAVRHAFVSDRGRVTVEARCENSMIHCCVSDDGSGIPSSRRGTGLQIIDALLRDISGHMERHFGSKGTAVTVTFPAVTRQG
jgi:two-component sensor histidine kinase